MSNVQQLFDSFTSSLDSIHVFQSQVRNLLPEIRARNSALRSLILDHLTKIISSKITSPAQKFYGVYFILKVLEDKNEVFVNEMTQKDELLTKIFHASQTDSSKTEAFFDRGAMFFSMNPTKIQSKAGVNFVKLCIEVIMYLDQTYGSADSNSPRHILRFVGGFLQKKIKIPKMHWFLNKKYEIPKNKELYCWNFNKNAPLVSSDCEDSMSEEEVDSKEVRGKAAIKRIKTLKFASQISPNRQRHDESGEEEEPDQNNEADNLLVITKCMTFSNTGVVDRKEFLRQSSKNSLDAEHEEEGAQTRKSKSSFISKLSRSKAMVQLPKSPTKEESGDNRKKSPLSGGSHETEWTPVNKKEESGVSEPASKPTVKKSRFYLHAEAAISEGKITDESKENSSAQENCLTKKSPLSSSSYEVESTPVNKKEEPVASEAVQKPTVKKSKFFVQVDADFSDEKLTDESKDNSSIQENRPTVRGTARELTFNKRLSSAHEGKCEDRLGDSSISEVKSIEISERNASDKGKDKAAERKAKWLSIFKPNNISDKAPLTVDTGDKEKQDKDSKKVPQITITPVSTSNTIERSRPVGPKDLEGFVSPTFSNRSTMSKKSPRLEEDLMKIQNSIRLSMSRSANTVSGKRDSILGNQSTMSVQGSSLLNASKASIERDLVVELPGKKDPFAISQSRVSESSGRLGDSRVKTVDVIQNSREIRNSLSSIKVRSETDVERKSFFGGGQGKISERATQIMSRSPILAEIVQGGNDRRSSLNVGIRSESNLLLQGVKDNGRSSMQEKELSTWKCVVVEQTPAAEGCESYLLNTLSSNRMAPKMYSVTEFREIEVRGIEKVGENKVRVNDVFSKKMGKENYKPEGRTEQKGEAQSVPSKMHELLGAYCVSGQKATKSGRKAENPITERV